MLQPFSISVLQIEKKTATIQFPEKFYFHFGIAIGACFWIQFIYFFQMSWCCAKIRVPFFFHCQHFDTLCFDFNSTLYWICCDSRFHVFFKRITLSKKVRIEDLEYEIIQVICNHLEIFVDIFLRILFKLSNIWVFKILNDICIFTVNKKFVINFMIFQHQWRFQI